MSHRGTVCSSTGWTPGLGCSCVTLPHPVFITASAEAIDLLAERHPTMRRIILSEVRQTPPAAGLMSRLEILASGPPPAAEPLFENGESVHLEDRAGKAVIHLVPDLPPLRLFAGLAASGGWELRLLPRRRAGGIA